MGTLESEYCGTCDICGKEADAAVEVRMGWGSLTPWCAAAALDTNSWDLRFRKVPGTHLEPVV
jgi:hypothetical protein